MQDTDTLRPEVVADRQIAAAWAEFYRAQSKADSLRRDAEASRRWDTDEAHARRVEQARLARAEAQRLSDAAETLEEQLYTGWSRFFLVQDGHIHSSRACHTLRWTTRIGWLPDLSGLTEADAVAAHGPLLCTVCFPMAPVEWTVGLQKERCAGSGTVLDHDKPHRTGFYSGNWGTCPVCGERASLTSTNRLRAHKPKN